MRKPAQNLRYCSKLPQGILLADTIILEVQTGAKIVFRRGVWTLIGAGVSSSQFNEINSLKGSS
jgi:hypothetical protein